MPGSIGYLLVGGLTAFASLFALFAVSVVAAASLVGVGVPAISEVVRLVRPLVEFERRRAGRRLGAPIVVAYQPLEGGLRAKLATVARDPANRRDVGWLLVHLFPGIVLAALAVALPVAAVQQAAIPVYWRLVPAPPESFGITADSWPRAILAALFAIPLAWLALQVPLLARGQALLARKLLGPAPGADLAVRVAELTATRAAALDAHGAELRRIERDLHDGAQARIAAVIMQLGLADQLREQDPAASARLVRQAQDTAEAALTELRDVVRTVYPPVLADRGLASAVSALAARSPIPVELALGDAEGTPPSSMPHGPHTAERRRPAAVEAAAYFVIAEALTNATKHSGAQQLRVEIAGTADMLTVEIRDDGVGAAVETEGGGLAGIRRRAEALDGRLLLSSPAGGPTVVRVELPCGT
ncbi:sensor histidine kinase [Nocardia yunnanensis]|uniref:sensor histidine kinase n=1 Tax=Nocardia yunnanensis TaxID=2382165 RepID=UPI001FEAFAF2|nr:sensor histidine kinase [Nocardia yunnanensis]